MSQQVYLNAYWSGSSVVLLRRDAQHQLVERRVPAEFSFFLKRPDFLKLQKEIKSARGVVSTRIEGDFVRVICRDNDFRYAICCAHGSQLSWLGLAGVESYEADLHPVKRFLIDSGCDIQKPVHANLDIETDSRLPFGRKEEMRILCWSLTHESGDRVAGVLEADTDQAERELLLDLLDELQHVDQIRCWNGDRFDEPVIRARLKHRGINIDPRRWLWLDAMECFRKYNMHSTESGDEKVSVALERVAESIGIDTLQKSAVDASKSWDLWAAGGAQRKSLVDRCIFDSWVMGEIERRTGYCDLHYSVCRTSGCFPDSRGLRALTHVESFLMRLAAKQSMRFPSKWGQENIERQKFKGAYVMEVRRTGIIRNVHVCDFSGMYPSIIQSWNMSPETHVPELSGQPGELLEDVLARLPKGHSVAPGTLQVFRTDVSGLLPMAVDTLKQTRRQYNDIKKRTVPNSPEWKDADRLSQGAKIAVNSCYGVIGSMFSRFFKREVAESVTLVGQWLIKQTIEVGENTWQIQSIYGDTDSVGAVGVSEETFRRFKDECNAVLYPSLLKRMGCERNEIELEYEKEFELLIVMAKKRYAGRFRHWKGSRAELSTKPEVKGLEFKRGDTIRLCRDFQKEVVNKLLLVGQSIPDPYPLTPDDFEPIIQRWQDMIVRGELKTRDIILSKSLKGGVASYDRGLKKDKTPVALPVHVEVAKILEKRGLDISEGVRIEYVVVDGDCTPLKAIPAVDYVPGCEDRAYIWESLVWPAIERVLSACWPTYRWSRFSQVKARNGGKGQSRYLAGQVKFGWSD